MKNLFCILFSITIATNLCAQKIKSDTASLELHCGWAAYTCPEIFAYKKLIAAKKYDVIIGKLINGTLTEKVISAMIIDTLTRSHQIILSDGEEKTFRSVTYSNHRLEVCYTCTWHYEGTIKRFFYPKKEDGMTELTPYGVIRDELFAD
jgi:hypothetical protein